MDDQEVEADLGRSRPSTVGNLKSGAKLCRLVLGKLPRQLSGPAKWATTYRRQLEQAVSLAHGQISYTHAHVIDAAVQDETGCGILRWLLFRRFGSGGDGDMASEQVAGLVTQMSRLKQSRNKWIEKLDLDGSEEEEALMYGGYDFDVEPPPPPTPPEPPAPPEPPEPPASRTE